MRNKMSRPSYEKVDYRLRPAKQIERKMLCETLQRLSHFAQLQEYRYVGFGSIYFSDFYLIHRYLGITDMISFEKEELDKERFEFNKPFHCIEIQYGESTNLLPKLDWKPRTIAWLDYDQTLTTDMLRDVACFTANAPSGSVIILTVDSDISIDKVSETISNDLGSQCVPTVNVKDWDVHKLRALYRDIITNHVQDTLVARNGALKLEKQIRFLQLFNFNYKDGTDMLTVGGLLYSTEDLLCLDACNFKSLAFVRCYDQPYTIEVPKLTIREIHHLDTQLPTCSEEDILEGAIPKDDRRRYAKIYRYFPIYAESDL